VGIAIGMPFAGARGGERGAAKAFGFWGCHGVGWGICGPFVAAERSFSAAVAAARPAIEPIVLIAVRVVSDEPSEVGVRCDG
jgi:hypothetical protein